MSIRGKNHEAWLQLEKDLELLQTIKAEGYVIITADQIRTAREPRLLTKIDSRESQPEFLETHGLGLLPRRRNEFCLGNFDIFMDVPTSRSSKPKDMVVPDYLGLSDGANSESAMILRALHAKVFDDFLGEEQVITSFGKMGTNSFSFSINGLSHPVDVRGAQIEIDAGLETESHLTLLEAKNHFARSFNLKQLYYPYRSWVDRASGKRQIRNLFVAFEEDEVQILEVEFAERELFSSGLIARTGRYQLLPSAPEVVNLKDALAQPTLPQDGRGGPLPQADRPHRILEIVASALEHGGKITLEQIALEQDFVDRQASYYANAGAYLGMLAPLPNRSFEITGFGRQVASQPPDKQRVALKVRLIKDPLVRVAVRSFLAGHAEETVMNNTIIEFQKCSEWSLLSDDTNRRRAQTFASWAKWVISGSRLL